MRSALLTSISHDLRTPLASIIGSITSLRKFWPGLDEPTRDGLLETVQDEAERLTRFVGNVLDVTKLEAQSVAPKLEAIGGRDAGHRHRRCAARLPAQRLKTDVPADLPPALVDPDLFRQVMFNLLDNPLIYIRSCASGLILRRRRGIGRDNLRSSL